MGTRNSLEKKSGNVWSFGISTVPVLRRFWKSVSEREYLNGLANPDRTGCSGQRTWVPKTDGVAYLDSYHPGIQFWSFPISPKPSKSAPKLVGWQVFREEREWVPGVSDLSWVTKDSHFLLGW